MNNSSGGASESAITTTNRRTVLQGLAGLGAGVWLGRSSQLRGAVPASDRLNLAFIGVGGQGRSNLNALQDQNIVALCDLDDERAGDAFEKFPKAQRFRDFRKMLDKLEGEIDGVVVSTPDHTHFHAAYDALQRGKHLYCEKPMAHNVEQVRTLTRLAEEKKVATQLGVQRHTLENMHRVVELIQGGAIGEVSEVYCWVGGDRGMPPYPAKTEQPPAHLDWDLWLGPAKERPFSAAYAPYGWRFWWDFGTGETGNWGCHILDIPFWALGLTYPQHVDAGGPKPHSATTPKSMQSTFKFAANDKHADVTLHWDHAKDGPEILKEHGLSSGGMNTFFIGSEGMLLCGFGKRILLPEEKFANYQAPEPSIPDSPGFRKEWVIACQGGETATCDFKYSGPLAETVLLANVAYRAQGGFEWNAKKLEAIGNPNAKNYLREEYRKGWEIG